MINQKEIYFDHAASSHIDSEVTNYLSRLYLDQIGNTSSIHRSGVKAMTILEKARIEISKKINSQPENVFFTSGATESNNLILQGFIRRNISPNKNEIIISEIEHSSVLEVINHLSLHYQIVVHKIKILKNGIVDLNELKNLVSEKTLLVSIMHVNNEIGSIQPIEVISHLCLERNIFLHIDGAQAFCKTDIDLDKIKVGSYTFSSHKIHGPKGVGGFYFNPNFQINPIFFGGGHENGFRPGTVPVELISSMAFAVSLFDGQRIAHIQDLSRYFYSSIKAFPSIRLNNDRETSVPNIFNIQILNKSGKEVMQFLDKNNIRVSIGSACKSSSKKPSHVLKALGLTDQEAFSSIRVSFGINNTKNEIDKFIEILKSF